ncbi:MAG: glycosyltransferase [Myxococcota bacterium]|nr:glycosyltransferase [Myxococcota bacterium]MDW8361751.1 glycosyltransferase [Myxococcales bacterium]
MTVLKPLCGVDPELEDNLRSFFEQDHPRFEIVFGVRGASDPAVAVVRRLIAAYPHVQARLVVHDGGPGLNPKVANLRAMLEAVGATHDVLVISDSNVRAGRGYLRAMQRELERAGTGLVTTPVRGRGARTIGAALENAHLDGEIVAAVALPTLLAIHPVVMGKSMMFRRSVFEALGGFESVSSVLAEDYVMGRMFHEAGWRVRIAADVVDNVTVQTTVRGFLQRQLRWSMMRWRLQPVAFLLEPLLRPIVLAALAPLCGVPWTVALGGALLLTAARDATHHLALHGRAGLWQPVFVGPLRDVLVTLVGIATPPFRHVRWRGTRVRLSAGTRLYARAPGRDVAPWAAACASRAP